MDAVHEVGASERSALPASPAHLLTADDVLAEGNQYGTYLAVCGALVPASSLPSSLCPPGCECDCTLYCLRCVRHVVRYVMERARVGEDEADHEPKPLGYYVGQCGHSLVIDYRAISGPAPAKSPGKIRPWYLPAGK